MLYGLPNYQEKKRYGTSSTPLHVWSLSSKHEHITPILFNLHWLPIRYRIVFKILLITYKALNNLAPSHIRDLLTPYIPSRQQRSSSKNLLVIPHFNLKTHCARSFSITAPTLWNTLSSEIMTSSSVSVFKNKLKTFLFLKETFLKLYYFVALVKCFWTLRILTLYKYSISISISISIIIIIFKQKKYYDYYYYCYCYCYCCCCYCYCYCYCYC